MDNLTAKEILSAYRASGADAQDPNFKGALDQCRRDPEMEAWFESEQSFDRKMARAFESVRGPVEGKRSIMTTVSFSQPTTSDQNRRRWFGGRIAIGIAAVLLISLSIFSLMPDPGGRFDESDFSLARLADSAMPLQFKASDPAELKTWLASQSAPQPAQLPDVFESARAAGCKVFLGRDGSKISLICYEIDGQIVHVFSFDERSRNLLQGAENEWWQEDGWNMVALNHGSSPIALATRGSKDLLKAYL
ncbi:MAG: hypothetical protein JJU20_09410 [Opitutales bacterium]|nr:hypothetical protein [Opitutales bacterium]